MNRIKVGALLSGILLIASCLGGLVIRGAGAQSESELPEVERNLPTNSEEIRQKPPVGARVGAGFVILPEGDLTASTVVSLVRKYGEFKALRLGDEYSLVRVTDDGMKTLVESTSLERLSLNANMSADTFQRISKLVELESLTVHVPDLDAAACFRAIAALPKLRHLGLRNVEFSAPISDETHELIASLNPRLQSLDFGEYGGSRIHRTMIPAIASIESLRRLELAQSEATPDDLKLVATKLPYLGEYTIKLKLRETSPIQFRPVNSATEMIVLLRYILGVSDAWKVQEAVINIRAGKLQRPLFEETDNTIEILERHFDIQVHSSSRSILYFIGSQYPELNQKIRDYLQGSDIGE